MANETILIVEDEAITAMDLQNQLTHLGYTVPTYAATGESAIKLARELLPDLILMDIKIKGKIDGITTAQKIKDEIDVPFIFLTAYSDKEMVSRVKVIEPYGYLLKPFDVRELNSVVAIALHKHKVEKQLRESERWLSTTLASIGDAVIATNDSGKIRFMNKTAERLTGWDKNVAVGRDFNEVFIIINETSGEKADSPIPRVIQEGIVVGLANHTILIARDGSHHPIEDSAAPIKDDKGNVIGVVLVFRDVSEKQKATSELKVSEQRYRLLAETATDAIITINGDSTILFANHAVETVFGYKPDELVGQSLIILMPESLQAKHLFSITRYMTTGIKHIPWTGVELIGRRKNGQKFPFEISFSEFHENDERHFTGVIRDITERKKTEAALVEEKERLSVTLRSITEGMIATDIKGIVNLINPNAEKLTGWTQREALGRSILEIYQIIDETTVQPLDNPFHRIIRGTQSTNDLSFTQDVILIDRDNNKRLISQSCAPIYNTAGEMLGIVLIVRDITDQRKTEMELQKSAKLESLGVLAGGIAHDFNNLMTGIMGNISLAREIINKNEPVSTILQEAEFATKRVKNLTYQLLTFSRGGAPIRKAASLVEVVTESATFALRGSKSKCEFNLPPQIANVEIDEGQIGQVIQNLVINANQAMPDGGIIKVTLADFEQTADLMIPNLAIGKYVMIDITDRGIGIHPENINKIFDPYYSTKAKGNGLGLAICYSIIKRHNGTILVESQPGMGSSFKVYLPVSLMNVTRENKPQKMAPIKGNGNILLCDDEVTVRETATTILTCLGYQVISTADAHEAISLYGQKMNSKAGFDVVILDLTLPGQMSGVEILNELKGLDSKVKAIVSSGYANEPVIANHKQYGFIGMITKPFDLNELSHIVHKVIFDLL